MKKLFIIAAAMLISTAALAQTAPVKNAQAVQKKIEKSDANIADAKKAASSNTWIDRANILIDAANAYTHKLFTGMPVAQMELPTELGKPNTIEEVEVVGIGTMSKYVYDQYDMYVMGDGTIHFWETTKPLRQSAFNEALSALEKAKELNAKDFAKSGRGTTAVERFVKESATNGSGLYSLGKYVKAGEMLNNAFVANTLIGIIDTTILYNSGLCYFAGGESKLALEKFEKMISFGASKDGLVYKQMGDCYAQLKEKENALAQYNKAFDINPSNVEIIGGLIDAYIAADKNPELVIDLLKKAQSIAPTHAGLHIVEGQIWAKIGNRENAIKAAQAAANLDATLVDAYFFGAYWNLLESDEISQKASKLDMNNQKTFEQMENKVKEMRLAATVLLEKAYELDPKSEDIIPLLRATYFVCRNYNKEFQTKYDAFIAIHPQE